MTLYLISLTDHSNRLIFIFEKHDHIDLVRLLTLPCQIENPTARKYWGTEIASLYGFAQEPESVEYGAFP